MLSIAYYTPFCLCQENILFSYHLPWQNKIVNLRKHTHTHRLPTVSCRVLIVTLSFEQ